MSYILSGALRGRLGPDEVEPLSDATVRLYRLRTAGSVDQAGESGFSILSEEQEQSREFLLFAMGRTNERGEFQIDLSEPSVLRPGIPVVYTGEPFQVDVYCRRAPRQSAEARGQEVQFTLGIFHPEWRSEGEDHLAEYSRELTEREWGEVRAHLDAWVICGRVVSGTARAPQPNLRVHAFDADMLQDDLLGTAVADAQGRFRIDYSSRRFRDTPVGMSFERGGPEVYFRVETQSGARLLDERRATATRGGRKGVGGCLYVELVVTPPVEISAPAV